MTNRHVQDERKQVSIFLLTVLEAVLNEQVKARSISHDAAKYVLAGVKDQARRKGWLE